VIAGNLYRLLARRLPRYERATPDRLWRHFLDGTGTLHLGDDTLTLDLRVRSRLEEASPLATHEEAPATQVTTGEADAS
jgi:hypothetical protein